jgi:hypothetical protein
MFSRYQKLEGFEEKVDLSRLKRAASEAKPRGFHGSSRNMTAV